MDMPAMQTIQPKPGRLSVWDQINFRHVKPHCRFSWTIFRVLIFEAGFLPPTLGLPLFGNNRIAFRIDRRIDIMIWLWAFRRISIGNARIWMIERTDGFTLEICQVKPELTYRILRRDSIRHWADGKAMESGPSDRANILPENHSQSGCFPDSHAYWIHMLV
jgi:hypothetical protein